MTPATIKKKMKAIKTLGFGLTLVDAITIFTKEKRFAEDIPLFCKHVITLLEATYNGQLRDERTKMSSQRDLEDLIKEIKHGKRKEKGTKIL